MPDPLRLGLIGCGPHVRSQHLPALRACAAEIDLVGVADPQVEARDRLLADWGSAVPGFASAEDLLATGRCQAVLVGTPSRFTADLSRRVAATGARVWIEKPIAATLAEAERLVTDLGDHPAMVSLNRRFDPAFAAVLAWSAAHRPRRIVAEMARENRQERDFLTETAIHLVDVVLALAGPVAITEVVPDPAGCRIRAGGTGIDVEVAVLPRSGRNAERLRVEADDGWAEAASGWFDSGAWTLSDASGTRSGGMERSLPDWQRNGTLDETRAFLSACRGEGAFHPRPADFLPAARFCAEAARRSAVQNASEPKT